MCTVSPRMKAPGTESLDMRGYVSSAILGSLCDEKHVIFECSALQGLRDEYASLISDVCTMKQFLWQDDLVSVAKFIHACLDKMFSCATGLSNDSQASDQPDVAGRDVI